MKEDKNRVIKLLQKKVGHEAVKSIWGICKAKGHDHELIVAKSSITGGF